MNTPTDEDRLREEIHARVMLLQLRIKELRERLRRDAKT